MSIDTAAKRFSAMNFCVQQTYCVLPVPDGSIDRLFMLHQYFGSVAAAATSGTRHMRHVAATHNCRKRPRRCKGGS
jgi:hypothetical protein